ncbi:MAG: ABC transporter permease, partial [Haloplanus sp.]
LLRSVDASPLRTFLAVRLPHALPDVFAGVKQSVTLAVVGAVVAEWILSDEGLGSLILIASENVQVDVMLAALVVLLPMGLALYGGVSLCYRAIAWQ